MKIVVDINHPAHVHFFKNFIDQMQTRGHDILITASKKDIAYDLLYNYGLEFEDIGSYGRSISSKIFNLVLLDIKMYMKVKKFDPDIFVGLGSIRAAHVSKLLGRPCIIFTDTEHSKEQYFLYSPFVDSILTPSYFKRDLGKKQIRYKGLHELAYLHPKYFKPDPTILNELGVHESDPFIIVRFVDWSASHDIGQHGIIDRYKFIKSLENYCNVFITSESKVDENLEDYRIKTRPEKIHSLLYYARLYIGEGATMATESAILGTPSIYISSLANQMGNFIELEKKYRLIYSYKDQNEAIKSAINIIQNKDSKEIWKAKKENLLQDTIDVTSFMVNFIENYNIILNQK